MPYSRECTWSTCFTQISKNNFVLKFIILFVILIWLNNGIMPALSTRHILFTIWNKYFKRRSCVNKNSKTIRYWAIWKMTHTYVYMPQGNFNHKLHLFLKPPAIRHSAAIHHNFQVKTKILNFLRGVAAAQRASSAPQLQHSPRELITSRPLCLRGACEAGTRWQPPMAVLRETGYLCYTTNPETESILIQLTRIAWV